MKTGIFVLNKYVAFLRLANCKKKKLSVSHDFIYRVHCCFVRRGLFNRHADLSALGFSMTTDFKVMRRDIAREFGYSADKRKRRRQHRQNAKRLFAAGGYICKEVARWNLYQARYL